MSVYPWHEASLAELVSKPPPHHAWMLKAERDCGAEALLTELVLSLMCDTPKLTGHACGLCGSCASISHQASHPDLLVLKPDEAEEEEGEEKVLKRRQIKLAQARAAIAFVSLSASSPRGKLVVVEPADALNLDAANALLKTLEEPPPNTRWLLLTHEPLRLPATIRSRCLLITLPSPDANEAIDFVAKIHPDDAEILLARAGGSVFAALAYTETRGHAEEFVKHLSDPKKLSAIALGEQLASLGRAEQKKRLQLYLNVLSHWLCDCASIQAGLTARYYVHDATSLSEQLNAVAPLVLMNLYRQVRQSVANIEHPLQARLVLESFLLNYKGLFTVSANKKVAPS